MSSEWVETALGDFVRLQRGHDLTASEQKSGPYPVMGSAGANGCHDIAKAKGPGVVIGRSGASMGKVHYSDIDYWPHNTCLYVTDFLGNNPKFAYYLLGSLDLAGYNSGSAQPSLNRNYIYGMRLSIPNRLEQDAIADFLSTLDDRITLLRETNKTLESIAQAIFKSWFVDFDPVHAKKEGHQPKGMDEETAVLFPDSFEESELGLVPRGWRIRTMSDVSTVGIGKTPPRKEPHWFSGDPRDIRWLSIRDMGATGVYASRTNEFLTREGIEKFNVRVVPDNTVLMSFKMTIGRVAITDGELTTNEAIAHFKLAPKAELTTEYIYLHLKKFDFSTLSSTSSIADAVNSKMVREIPILAPSAQVLAVFQSYIGKIFEKLKNTEQQVQTLATLRDTLLPRLISGQLRLLETETLAEELS